LLFPSFKSIVANEVSALQHPWSTSPS